MANIQTWRDSLERLRDDITESFDRLTRRPGGQSWFDVGPSVFGEGNLAVDIQEDENELRVSVEMPGLEKEDFHVELQGNRLIVRGEKKHEEEKKEKNYVYSERSYGSFFRTIPLPCPVDEDKVEAKYRNGVLKLKLPKSAESRGKKIEVEVGDSGGAG